MYYLTAQRVHSRRLDIAGINAYWHMAAEVTREPGESELMLVRRVSENPGSLLGMRAEVPPGGNTVQAFLDVVTSTQVAASRLEKALLGIRNEIVSGAAPEKIRSTDGCLVSFYVSPSLGADSIYGDLVSAVVSLLDAPGSDPLRIVIEANGEATRYRLDDRSAERIAIFHPPDWKSPRVDVPRDVEDDFSLLHGEIREHLIEVLTGIDRDHVRGLGGIQYVSSTGKELGRWPPPSSS